MKLIFLLASVALFSNSCSKSGKGLDNGYLGKWKNTGSFHSTGGPVIFNEPATDSEYIEFRIGGGFQSNMNGYNFESYKMLTSNKATLYNTMNRSSMDIEFSIINGILKISRLNCDEGCGNFFLSSQR